MLDTSKIYKSNNYGDFKIVNYSNSQNIEIEFISTGFKTTTRSSHVITGKVKDKLVPTVYGVGYMGEGGYIANKMGVITSGYSIWSTMLARCYCPKAQKKQPTYIGVTVCKDWHNFQNFSKWFDENHIEGFHMDKDINQRGAEGKEYSPKNCSFVSPKDNYIEAHAKHYKVCDPTGVTYEVYNMAEFCRENGLTSSGMSSVCLGKSNQHRGWTKA